VRQTSRKHASSERVQRSRVALLTNTYKDGYHYWEAVDLCVAQATLTPTLSLALALALTLTLTLTSPLTL
jgi:hypothetical protein